MRAEEIITVVAFYIEALLLQLNSTKCISYEINNSRPIYTIYKEAKMFWNNVLYRIEKKTCLSLRLCQFESC